MTTALILFIVFMVLQAATVLLLVPAWKRVAGVYRPMLLFLLLNFVLDLAELLIPGKPFVLISTSNIQYLGALLLIIWQARLWKVFTNRPWLFWFWLLASLLCWGIETFVTNPGENQPSWYYTTTSLIIALMAIEMINSNLFKSRIPFFSNPVFLFSTGLVFSYALWGLMDLFTVSLLHTNQADLLPTYYLYISLNIVTQLLFIRAVWCLPSKENYVSY